MKKFKYGFKCNSRATLLESKRKSSGKASYKYYQLPGIRKWRREGRRSAMMYELNMEVSYVVDKQPLGGSRAALEKGYKSLK